MTPKSIMLRIFMPNIKERWRFTPSRTVLSWQVNLPPKKHKLVIAWIEIHKEDLMADWELAVNGRTPMPIRGLDQ